jgi:hypothetical protein
MKRTGSGDAGGLLEMLQLMREEEKQVKILFFMTNFILKIIIFRRRNRSPILLTISSVEEQ